MEKKYSMNLITAFNWVIRKLDSADLPANQQLALFHVLAKVNANFFKPTPISVNKLAAQMCVSKRTAKTALDALIAANLIKDTEGGYTLAFGKYKNNESTSTADEGRINSTVAGGVGYFDDTATPDESKERRNVIELFKSLYEKPA